MATRFVKASYQEIIDLHTESDHVTAIGIHTPTGDTPRKMFKGYFDQYKKFRYVGAKITFAPVAKLPADPLSVSYEAGEPTIDPRDLANPILVHGCHGDDMGTILNKLYGDNNTISDGMDGLDFANELIPGSPMPGPLYDAMERLYYKALTDRTWKKAGIQRGFSKSGLRPLLYTLATNHQITPTSKIPNVLSATSEGVLRLNGGVPTSDLGEPSQVSDGFELENFVDPTQVEFFTPHLTRLGWMDTRSVITTVGEGFTPGTDEDVNEQWKQIIQSGLISQINYTELPKLFMLCILLPPAYKTEMYFRAIITHYFQFKDFRGVSFMPEQTGVPSYFNANEDLFDAAKFNDVVIDEPGTSPGPSPTPSPTDDVDFLNIDVANYSLSSSSYFSFAFWNASNPIDMTHFCEVWNWDSDQEKWIAEGYVHEIGPDDTGDLITIAIPKGYSVTPYYRTSLSSRNFVSPNYSPNTAWTKDTVNPSVWTGTAP